MELIDKAAIVANLKRRLDEHKDEYNRSGDTYAFVLKGEVEDILSSIDTIEVKEVDLEKHLKEDIEDVLFDLDGVAVKGATHYLTVEDVKDIAKHFFELGIKAKVE